MAKTFLLSLDAGGGGGHCMLVDLETGRRTRAFRPWRHPVAPGTGGIGVDLDLEAIWSGLADAAREALARAGAARGAVAGVAATSMRHATIVLDDAGAALLATPNRDARAAGEAFQMAGESGPAIYDRAGHWPTPLASAVRLRWLAGADPDRWRRAHAVLGLSDWIARRLSGVAASEPTQAAETLLFDIAARAWSRDLAAQAGVPPRLLPELRAAGSRLGGLTPEAARDLGLVAGIPVAVAGADTQCGLLGAGAIAPGDAAAIAGTTVPVQLVVDRAAMDAQRRSWTTCHLLPALWIVESNAGPMGEALAWLAHLFFGDQPQAVARLVAEAGLSSPGAAGIFSSLGADVMDARELRLPLGTLSLSHLASAGDPQRRSHLARGVVEGMACAIRANLERVAEVAGRTPERLRFAGGIARSDAFTRVLADVLGIPVERGSTAEATGLGAAMCAGVGAGLFADLAEASRRLAGERRVAEPSPEDAATCGELYDAWRRLAAARAEADALARQMALPAVLRRLGAAEPPRPLVSRPRILVTAELDEAALARLRRIGDVEYASFRERMRLLAGDDLVRALEGVQVLVTEIDIVDAAALRRLPELRVVFSCRGHAVNVDLAACTAAGVPVLHAPGRNADAVADLTIAFLLELSRKLPAATAFLRRGDVEAGDTARMGEAFSTLRGDELCGRTVGLVGMGAVGSAVARRLAAFGARVIACDPGLGEEAIALAGAEAVGLDELLARSDLVSLHAAVTPESRGMIGAAELARMKRGAFLVNTARAALVDEAALAEALQSGQLAGAALDVFATEPPGADDPLLACPSLIATPHVGGNTAQVAAHQGAIVVAELERLLRGERPRHVLDPEALDGFDLASPRRAFDEAMLARLGGASAPAVSDLQRAERPAARPTAPAAAAPSASAGAAAAPEPAPAQAAPVPAPAQAAPVGAAGEIAQRMARLVEAFVGRLEGDAALAAFAAGKDVTLRFTLPDVALRFYLRFRDGAARGALGDPDARPDVELKMRAEVLDGMFRGTLNPMQAATGGRLSFSGDTVKAMALQQAQADLSRLYSAARAEVGDPGDLASLPGGARPAPAPHGTAGAGPAAAGPAGAARPAVARVGDVRDDIVATVDELYRAELITATGGNVSARVPGRDEMWITPSQMFKGELRPDMLVRLDFDGNVLEGSLAPSSEHRMHAAIYRVRPEAQAIVHAHAPHATVLANVGLPFLPVSTEAAFLGDVPRVGFLMPGSAELAAAVAEAARTSWAVLMQNHGVIVAGRSLRRAADMVEIIDRSAEIILACYAVERTPSVLPDEVVRTLRQMGDMMA